MAKNKARSQDALQGGAAGGAWDSDASSFGTYPGGKSGAGIYQRLINQIPKHRCFVSLFAGHCGVSRRIKPAEHMIVIDQDAEVCERWKAWSRSKEGRAIEIINGCGIRWLETFTGRSRFTRRASTRAAAYDATGDGELLDSATHCEATEYFLFADPPYVLSQRSHGKAYRNELTDEDHGWLVKAFQFLKGTNAMLCGYASDIYDPLYRWRIIDHQVPTRGGLQQERLWMNYGEPIELHDYSYLGDTKRERERIRRRQRKWVEMLSAMEAIEANAMVDAILLARRSLAR